MELDVESYCSLLSDLLEIIPANVVIMRLLNTSSITRRTTTLFSSIPILFPPIICTYEIDSLIIFKSMKHFSRITFQAHEGVESIRVAGKNRVNLHE